MTDPIKALAEALGKTTDEVTGAFSAIFNLEPTEEPGKAEDDNATSNESTEDEPANTGEESTDTAEDTEGTDDEQSTAEDKANDDDDEEDTEETDGEDKVKASADNDDYVLVPREHLDFLTKAAALATDAAERQDKADKAAEVDKWIEEGRFSAALRSKALSAMETDPDTARSVWGSLPVNTVNRKESGYGVDTTDVSTTADNTRLNDLADKSKFATPDFY